VVVGAGYLHCCEEEADLSGEPSPPDSHRHHGHVVEADGCLHFWVKEGDLEEEHVRRFRCLERGGEEAGCHRSGVEEVGLVEVVLVEELPKLL
jgi:hypothetical protein